MGDSRDALAALAQTQLGLVTRDQVLAAGVSMEALERRLSSGELVTIRRRVYRLRGATPDSPHQRLLATCLSLGPGAVASHRTAAWLWELDRSPEPSCFDVTVPHGKRVRLSGFRVHQRRPALTDGYAIRGGVPVTLLPRTLLDLAPLLTDAELEVALDSAGRYRFAFVEDVAEFLGSLKSRGIEGIDRLHQLVQLRRGDEPTGSAKETEVLQMIRRAGIEPPFTQYPIFRYPDRPLCHADFAWPRKKIALFSDSNYHLGKRARLDAIQRTELTNMGWKPVVVYPKLLKDRKWISTFAELFHVRLS